MPATSWTPQSDVSSAWGAVALPVSPSGVTASVVTSVTTAVGSGDTLAYDTFADVAGTLLQNHVSDSGVAYAKHPAQPGDGSAEVGTQSDIFYDNFDQFAVGMGVDYIALVTPTSADYTSAASYIMRSAAPGVADGLGVSVRGDPISRTHYLAWWNNQTAAWELYRFVSGGGVLLGSISTQLLLGVGTPRAVALTSQGTGASVALTFSVDSTNIMQIADANALRITAIGQPGIRFYNVNSGTSHITKLHMDNFLVKTLTSIVTSTTTSSATIAFGSALWDSRTLPSTAWSPLA